jgi:hypothetical protein
MRVSDGHLVSNVLPSLSLLEASTRDSTESHVCRGDPSLQSEQGCRGVAHESTGLRPVKT